MAGFGSLVPGAEGDWRDAEAQAALAAQQADEARKKAEARTWGDTARDVLKAPYQLAKNILTAPYQGGDNLVPQAGQQYGAFDPRAEVASMPTSNPVSSLAHGLIDAGVSGATAPHDVLSGELKLTDAEGHTTPEAVGRAFDLASIAGGGSVAGTAERAGVRASELARPYHEALEAPKADATAPKNTTGQPVSAIASRPEKVVSGSAPALLSDTAKPGAAMAAVEHAAPFATSAEPAIEQIARKVGTGEQWANDLKRYGAKPEELEHRGTTDMLAAKAKQPMQKEEVAAHLEANPVNIQTIEKATPKWEDVSGDEQHALMDRYNDSHDRNGSPEEVRDWYDEQVAKGELTKGPKFSEYQLPGGENYRERLLTLPNGGIDTARLRELDAKNISHSLTPTEQAEYSSLSAQATKNPPNDYRGAHWDEPNVIVHRRSTDRVMPGEGYTVTNPRSGNSSPVFASEAEAQAYQSRLPASIQTEIRPAERPIKTLHAEEIQSDWHQTGSKSGYRDGSEPSPEEIRALREEKDQLARSTASMKPSDPAYQQAAARAAEIDSRLADRVPDGPFKDSWHRLALHDQIREAAEKGFDRISWTSGEAHPTNPKNLNTGGGTPNAEREAAYAKANAGLVKHYDERLVNTANKIGKPHGVGVQKGTIPFSGGMSGSKAMDRMAGSPGWEDVPARHDGRGEWFSGLTPDRRDQLFADARAKPHDIYHMDVPQSLKDQALKKGFSMFEDSGKAGAAIDAAEHLPNEHGFGPLDSHPAEQALTVNDILHPDTPAMKTGSRDVETIAKELHDRGSAALEKMGVEGGRIEKSAPHTDELLSRGIASEIKAALGRGNTASDWYTHKIAEAMDIASELHPELKNDPHQKMGFTTALAVTSQGEAVTSNVRLANQAYEHFKKTGRFPTNVEAKNGPAMNSNFVKMNGLLDQLGPQGTRDFLHKEFTVKELEQAGYDVGGENKGTKVYGSAILGPKIGQGFYQNLNGNYKPVTMDLWFMRAWGRMTGTLTGKTDLSKPTARLTEAMRANGLKPPENPADLYKFADETVKAHERDFKKDRKLYDSGEKTRSEMSYAAERYLKNSSGINEQPTSGSQRAWMRSVVDRARDILGENGHKVTNADLQAIWWYPEKELYAKLGGRDSDKINIDYATAFRDLKNKGATNAEAATGAVRSVERRSGPTAKADDASAGKGSSRRDQKDDGQVKFGALAREGS